MTATRSQMLEIKTTARALPCAVHDEFLERIVVLLRPYRAPDDGAVAAALRAALCAAIDETDR